MTIWLTQEQVYGGLVLFVMLVAAVAIGLADRPRRDGDDGEGGGV